MKLNISERLNLVYKSIKYFIFNDITQLNQITDLIDYKNKKQSDLSIYLDENKTDKRIKVLFGDNVFKWNDDGDTFKYQEQLFLKCYDNFQAAILLKLLIRNLLVDNFNPKHKNVLFDYYYQKINNLNESKLYGLKVYFDIIKKNQKNRQKSDISIDDLIDEKNIIDLFEKDNKNFDFSKIDLNKKILNYPIWALIFMAAPYRRMDIIKAGFSPNMKIPEFSNEILDYFHKKINELQTSIYIENEQYGIKQKHDVLLTKLKYKNYISNKTLFELGVINNQEDLTKLCIESGADIKKSISNDLIEDILKYNSHGAGKVIIDFMIKSHFIYKIKKGVMEEFTKQFITSNKTFYAGDEFDIEQFNKNKLYKECLDFTFKWMEFYLSKKNNIELIAEMPFAYFVDIKNKLLDSRIKFAEINDIKNNIYKTRDIIKNNVNYNKYNNYDMAFFKAITEYNKKYSNTNINWYQYKCYIYQDESKSNYVWRSASFLISMIETQDKDFIKNFYQLNNVQLSSYLYIKSNNEYNLMAGEALLFSYPDVLAELILKAEPQDLIDF
jgi:hypothetical protein